MPKHSTMPNASSLPNQTRVQREAHAILTEHGFEYVRQTGKGMNMYRHPDGRTQSVAATPRNADNTMHMLRQNLNNPHVQRVKQRKEAQVAATQTPVDLVTKIVAMADPFLLKEHNGSREAVLARASAFEGYVKRVVEKHGPVATLDLTEAVERIGFSHHQLAKARASLGLGAFREGGPSGGKWVIAFPYQMPEDKRPRQQETTRNGVPIESHENGVQVEADDPVETPAESPEKLPEAVLAASGRVVVHPPAPDVETAERILTEAPRVLDRTAVPFERSGDTDVRAAAELLLSSLGVKMPGEDARQALRDARAALRAANDMVLKADAACTMAIESLRQQ